MLIEIPCPLCDFDGENYRLRVPKNDLHIRTYGDIYKEQKASIWVVCNMCGFVYQNPRPSKEALNEYYLQSSYHVKEIEIDIDAHVRFSHWYYDEKFLYSTGDFKTSVGRVFDIGCGRGEALRVFADNGWDCFGVEPDKNLCTYAIEKSGLSKVQHGILDSNFILDEKVDLVFSNHAFEHFADLDNVMSGIKNILKEGGLLCTFVPTYNKNRSNLSRRWMNSAHYSMFTHSSLNQLLSKYGFSEVKHTYRGWSKEIDDLWHVAKLDLLEKDQKKFYENSKLVKRYIDFVNPARSIIFFPIFSFYSQRVHVFKMLKRAVYLAFTDPNLLLKAIVRAISK